MNSLLFKTVVVLALLLIFITACKNATKEEIPPEEAAEKRFPVPTRKIDLSLEQQPVFNANKQVNVLSLDSADFYKLMKKKGDDLKLKE